MASECQLRLTNSKLDIFFNLNKIIVQYFSKKVILHLIILLYEHAATSKVQLCADTM